MFQVLFQDDCPKVSLFKDRLKNNKLDVNVKYHVSDFAEESNYQFGIYIRNTSTNSNNKEFYFAAVDNTGLFVLDVIGVLNNSKNINFCSEGHIFLSYDANVIKSGFIVNGIYNTEIEYYFENDDEIELGLACKTWGNGKRLKITFSDCQINC